MVDYESLSAVWDASSDICACIHWAFFFSMSWLLSILFGVGRPGKGDGDGKECCVLFP